MLATVETRPAGARLGAVPTTIAPTDQQPDDHDPAGGHDPVGGPTSPSAEATLERSALERAPERDGAAVSTVQGRRRLDVKMLIASFGIAVGLVVIVLGVLRSVTGREQQGLPDAIENIDPIRGAAQVPQQTRVFVDLVNGYEAVMIVDGVELDVFSLDGEVGQKPPALGGEQEEIIVPPGAIYEPGNNTLTFVPGPSQPIEAFDTGVHSVTIRYWPTVDGPDRSRTFTWTFYVV